MPAWWDAFWGLETKTATPEAPAAPPPEVKQLLQSIVWSPGSYPDADGNYWNPLLTPAASASTTTWNSAVFACLGVKAKAFQEAPLGLVRTLTDGTEERVDQHPVLDLLAEPHPSLSLPEFDGWLSMCLDTAGEAYFRKIRDRAGAVRELWPLSPSAVTPETDDEDKQRGVFISRYVYDDGAGHREELPVEDVVHHRLLIDDADHRRGLSPLRRLLREVASDEELTRFLEELVVNAGVASLAVTVPPGPVLSQEQAEQIRDRLRADYGGANRNRGHVAVVGNGATLSQIGFSPQQLDLKIGHYLPETRISAVFGVPAMLVGFAAGLEHTIYNNMEQAQEHLYEQTISPLWRQVAATWTKQLLRTDYSADRRLRLKFDVSKVGALQENKDAQFTRLSLAVDKGWMTKDEARAEVGLDPLPNGLGEAKDPMELLRATAEARRPGLPPGNDQQDGQQEQRALTGLEAKQYAALKAFPEFQAAIQTMLQGGVEQDFDTYFAGQRERVMARAKGG